MDEYCPISCKLCTPLNDITNRCSSAKLLSRVSIAPPQSYYHVLTCNPREVSGRYKMCVERVLNGVVSGTLSSIERFTVSTVIVSLIK